MDPHRVEVDANYDFFERNLSRFLEDHAGQYVLLKDRAAIDFFEKPGDAFRAGVSRFHDGLFSIQEITDEPLDLGFLSLAGN